MKYILSTFLILVLLPSCKKESDSKPIDLNVDHALRSFLDVKSLTGVITIPKGQTAYVIDILEFEEGKLARHGGLREGNLKDALGPFVSAQLLWGKLNGESRTTLITAGVSGSTGTQSEFWTKLDGGKTEWGYDVRHPEYDGYMVLGMAWSNAVRDGHANTGVGGDLIRVIEAREFVAALVVKFFASAEDAAVHVEKSRQNKPLLPTGNGPANANPKLPIRPAAE